MLVDGAAVIVACLEGAGGGLTAGSLPSLLCCREDIAALPCCSLLGLGGGGGENVHVAGVIESIEAVWSLGFQVLHVRQRCSSSHHMDAAQASWVSHSWGFFFAIVMDARVTRSRERARRALCGIGASIHCEKASS